MPGWVWLMVGFLIGGVIALTIYVKMPHAIDGLLPHPNLAAQPTTSTEPGVAPEGSAPTEPKKTPYTFYALLPEKEVVFSDKEISAEVKAEQAAKLASEQQAAPALAPGASVNAPHAATLPNPDNATSPTAIANPPTASDTTAASPDAAATHAGQYLLQAGAFRNGEQADDMKARIAMLGLVGRVEVVQTPAGEMHRVRLGPYATASELEQAKQKLGGGGIAAVAIRVK